MSVIVDKQNKSFTRRSIILSMANQDGGAHVDPQLNEDYYALTRLNSIQDFFGTIQLDSKMSPSEKIRLMNEVTKAPPVSPANYTVRRIAHEVLISIFPHLNLKSPLLYQVDSIYGGESIVYSNTYTNEKGQLIIEMEGRTPLDDLPVEVQEFFKKHLGSNNPT